jgi:anion transporter
MQKWLPTVILSALLIASGFIMPYTGLDLKTKQALIIFFVCIVFWIFRPIPEYLSGMLGGVALILIAGIPMGQVLNSFGSPVWWMGLLAMILGITINHTGLGRRIAYFLLSKAGSTPLRILFSTTMVNNILAPFIPSNTARGALLCGITDSLCDSLGYVRGEKKGDHSIILANLYINTTNTFMFMTAMAGNLLCVRIIAEATGHQVTWMEWFYAAFIPGFPLMLILPVLINRLFPMQPPPEGFKGTETAKQRLAELGPMTRAEWSAAIIMSVTLLLWITERLHGYDSTICSFTLVLLLVPGIGAVKWEDIGPRIPWPALIWLGFAMGMGAIIDRLKGFRWLVDRLVTDSVLFQSMSFTSFMIVMIVCIVFIHFIFAGMSAMVMVIVPISIALAQQRGFDPVAVGLAASMATTAAAFFMPFNSAPNLIFYATGRFDVKQQITGAVPLALLICLALILALFFWWPFIGMIKL